MFNGPKGLLNTLLGVLRETELTINLTWTDLIIDDFSPEEANNWLSEWSWLITGKFALIFLSKFGDCFLRRPDGSTEILDVIEGKLEKISSSPDEFEKLVNSQEWQEDKLLSYMVYELHQIGLVPSKGQCYGFAPHPAFVGDLKAETVQILDIPVWESICSQVFKSA